MRVAIAKIFQETNTFNPVPFKLADFERFGIYFGEEIIDKFRGIGELGGFISVCEEQGENVELFPLIGATSWAGGRWTSRAMGYLEEKLLEELEKVLPVDGVLISLHGSMASEDVDDVSGHLLTNVRKKIGGEIPLIATLDHHANITRQMVASSDAMIGYKECPHTDSFETGVRAARLLFAVIRKEAVPAVGVQKIPMLTPADKFWTSEPPLKDWFNMAAEFESLPGVLSVSLFPVQPWLDVPELGWTTLVITNRDRLLAQSLAVELANKAWQIRRDMFGAQLFSPDKAIRHAKEQAKGPIILADGSDNMNSGAPGDSTCLLKEMLKQGITCITLMPIVDPEAVEQALSAGIGKEISLFLGGKVDKIFSEPVQVTGLVSRISDGKVTSTGHLPIEFNMGKTILFEVGSMKIVISEYPGPSHEPGVYQHIGLDPDQAKIVVVKTPVGFRDSYKNIAKEALVVDCPGLSTPHLELLGFTKAPRPIFPLDEITEWKATT
jgi:microcystin degradation protein MlrC